MPDELNVAIALDRQRPIGEDSYNPYYFAISEGITGPKILKQA